MSTNQDSHGCFSRDEIKSEHCHNYLHENMLMFNRAEEGVFS